jgi:hypothetical protein
MDSNMSEKSSFPHRGGSIGVKDIEFTNEENVKSHEAREEEATSRGSSREFEKWGENAASIVRNTFSALNDLMDELQSADESQRVRGRFEEIRKRYPQAATLAAIAAGAFTGGALVWYIRGGDRSQRIARNVRRFSRNVPRAVNRMVKRVA